MCKTIFSFGEILWDRLPDKTILGGAPFNFTFRVNSLNDKGLIISRIGMDELGIRAYEKAKELGINTRFVQWDEHKQTGTVDVYFDDEKNPDYTINTNAAYDYIQVSDKLIQAVASADCFCFGTLAQREETSLKTLQRLLEAANSALKFYDVNLRRNCYNKTIIIQSLLAADICKLNENEAIQIGEMLNLPINTFRSFLQELVTKFQLKYCIVTFSERGAYVFSDTGESVYVPGYKVQLVDPLGAGDAFSAGFVHKLLRNCSLTEVCTFGNILGALAVTKQGATFPISSESIDRFDTLKHEVCFEPEFSVKNERHIT